MLGSYTTLILKKAYKVSSNNASTKKTAYYFDTLSNTYINVTKNQQEIIIPFYFHKRIKIDKIEVLPSGAG